MVGLQHRGKQMGKPSYEFLPRCAEFLPLLWGEQEALCLVAVEHLGQLCGGAAVDYHGILFVVEAQAA